MAEVIRLIIRELCLAGECFILLGSKKLQMIEGNRIATDPKNKKKQEFFANRNKNKHQSNSNHNHRRR